MQKQAVLWAALEAEPTSWKLCIGCGYRPDPDWRWCPDCGGRLKPDEVVDLQSADRFVVEWPTAVAG
jgi:hypothetical protein